jgi:hypothetical protein
MYIFDSKQGFDGLLLDFPNSAMDVIDDGLLPT